MTTMVDRLMERTAITVVGCDRELEHLRRELADFPTRPRRAAILASVDRWLDQRLAAAGDPDAALQVAIDACEPKDAA